MIRLGRSGNLKLDRSVMEVTDSRRSLNVENGGGQQLASKRAAEPVAVKLKELRFRSKKKWSQCSRVLRRLIDGVRRKLVAAVYV
jgi:hypothetical protein